MSAPDYRKFVPFVHKWEGGLSKNPRDKAASQVAPGQYHTNMGITFDAFKAAAPSFGISPTYHQFVNLTVDQLGLWVKRYWDRATFNNSINSQIVAESITSWVWGSGGKGIKNLQQLLNSKYKAGLTVDGGMGPKTVSVINKINPNKLFIAMLIARAKYFLFLSESDADYKSSYNGWMNRLADFSKRHGYDLYDLTKRGGIGILAVAGLSLAAYLFHRFYTNNQKQLVA